MLLALVIAPLVGQTVEASFQAASLEPQALVGTWEGELQYGREARPLRFALWSAPGEDGMLEGGLRMGEDTSFIDALVDREEGVLRFELMSPDGSFAAWIEPGDAGFVGEIVYDENRKRPLRARRVRERVAEDLRLEVDLGVERPMTVDRSGLPDFLEEELQAVLATWAHEEGAVGVSAAYLYDWEVAGIRSVGWQDFAHRTPANQHTRYRWASISKPVTAVVALQLYEAGELDLMADIRTYVPEFPEKKWTVTAADLLCHQGGIVHYQHGPIRTEREYDDPNPFRDSLLALDMFRESPLIHEPGSKYSYSTHGYALLGAVVERAGKQAFREQVRLRIVEPLGMTTLRPDHHQSESIPNQTVGYARVGNGRTIDAGDSNVAWKLAGGGFLSNVEDLALFGLGLMEDRILRDETREAMFTPKTTSRGAQTNYGWGVSTRAVKGHATIGHGGAQRKARTFLRVVPELGVGVAVMCNTEGTNIEALANRSLAAMLD